MSFDNLKKEVDNGLSGKNNGIPMGFKRLNRYIGIRKSMYFLVGGLTGLTIIQHCLLVYPKTNYYF